MKKNILTLTLVVLMLPVPGCQESQAQKANPKQSIENVLLKLQKAYVKEDVEGIMSFYSEDFSGANGQGKSGVQEYISGMKDQGYLTGTEVVLDDVVIEVAGNTATVAPVTYSGDWGQVNYDHTFKKEGLTWKIIAAEQSY